MVIISDEELNQETIYTDPQDLVLGSTSNFTYPRFYLYKPPLSVFNVR